MQHASIGLMEIRSTLFATFIHTVLVFHRNTIRRGKVCTQSAYVDDKQRYS